ALFGSGEPRRICGPGRCGPRQGGYTCLCHPGFWLSTQGTHCIGEGGAGGRRVGGSAWASEGPLHPHVAQGTVSRCLSAPDMDECRQRPRPCANGRCENTVGSFRCICAPGYRAALPGPECRGERRAQGPQGSGGEQRVNEGQTGGSCALGADGAGWGGAMGEGRAGGWGLGVTGGSQLRCALQTSTSAPRSPARAPRASARTRPGATAAPAPGASAPVQPALSAWVGAHPPGCLPLGVPVSCPHPQ
uniref:EGF-like domain-containing protein n=1 Tax=Chelonoidis abingdonii TaxID=106734 RepID=A0A8C0JE94_CHEAB